MTSLPPHSKEKGFTPEDSLVDQIDALLEMDAKGWLVPHGIGGLARELLTKCRAELSGNRRTMSAARFAHELEYQRQEEFGCESYADFGRRYGLSDEGIRLVCKGKRSPPASMLDRFGLKKVVTYERVDA